MSDGFIIKRGGSGASGGGVDPSVIARTAANITADMLKGVTKIGRLAFYRYERLKSIEIPNGVTIIYDYAFEYCNIESIEISSSVTNIYEAAFYGCSKLAIVTVKATTPPDLYVDYDDHDPFYGCNLLNAFYVPAESVEAYKAASGWSTYADKIQAIPSD